MDQCDWVKECEREDSENTVFYIFNNIWVGLGQKENMNGQDKAFTKGLLLPLPKKLSGTPLFLLYKQYLGQIWLVLEQGGGGGV